MFCNKQFLLLTIQLQCNSFSQSLRDKSQGLAQIFLTAYNLFKNSKIYGLEKKSTLVQSTFQISIMNSESLMLGIFLLYMFGNSSWSCMLTWTVIPYIHEHQIYKLLRKYSVPFCLSSFSFEKLSVYQSTELFVRDTMCHNSGHDCLS